MESVLMEAERTINGDRQQSYGSPLRCHERIAGMTNAAFSHKLLEKFTPEDIMLFMILVKVGREVEHHKRDNIVDIAGYAGCIEMAGVEREELSK